MTAWSNIQVSLQDPEIVKIDELEKNLGRLPDSIDQIRKLITRFEICHFKCQHHLRKIKDSIMNLQPTTEPTKIGINHIRNGENAWINDTTGRSLLGQQYLWSIQKWLSNDSQATILEHQNKKLNQQIKEWLGDKSPDKLRLVGLLLARLTWDWKSYEELRHGGEFKKLELQACRMDICHYAFPANLDLLLQGIGRMKPVEKFEGCGTFDTNIRAFIENEFLILNDLLKFLAPASISNKNKSIKVWLMACLAKTLKEQVNLSIPMEELTK